MAGVNTGIDVHTFINIVIIWALVDLQILDPDMFDEQEFAMFTELGLFDINSTYSYYKHNSSLPLSFFIERYYFVYPCSKM